MNPILDAFFKSESVVNYQIDSMNYFYASRNNPDSIMQQIVDETKISDDATLSDLKNASKIGFIYITLFTITL